MLDADVDGPEAACLSVTVRVTVVPDAATDGEATRLTACGACGCWGPAGTTTVTAVDTCDGSVPIDASIFREPAVTAWGLGIRHLADGGSGGDAELEDDRRGGRINAEDEDVDYDTARRGQPVKGR